MQVAINTATIRDSGAVVAVQKMTRSLDVTTTSSAVTQRVPAAAIAVGTQFLDDTLNVTLAAGNFGTNTTTQASLLQTKLRTLSACFNSCHGQLQHVGGNHYEITFPGVADSASTPSSGGTPTNATVDEVLGNDLQFLPESVMVAGHIVHLQRRDRHAGGRRISQPVRNWMATAMKSKRRKRCRRICWRLDFADHPV